MLYKKINVQIKEIDEVLSIIRGVFSTSDEDRHGEIVGKGSWVLDEYLANPVVLFAHNHSQPAIGKVVSLGYNENGDLEGEIQFAVKEYDFAKTIFNLYKGGYMKAFSVGFMSGKQEEKEGVTVLLENILYEISTVNVPANAMALAKAKGIDISAIEKLNAMQDDDEQEHEQEGRVLSARNRGIVTKAVSALNELLNADKSADKNVRKQKGRKLHIQVDSRQHTINIINKTVRSLIKVKH